MPNTNLAERRLRPRYQSDGLMVYVRCKGRMGQLEGLATDFNRHGVALVLDQPLPKEAVVYVALCSGDMKLSDVIGVVHNCIGLSNGYRCGIQFRTGSRLQMDQAMTERELSILEARYKTQKMADEI